MAEQMDSPCQETDLLAGLSEANKRGLQDVIKDVRAGSASLVEENGHYSLHYPSPVRKMQCYSHPHTALIAEPKGNTNDLADTCLQAIKVIKELSAPSGASLDKTKISLKKSMYREDKEYEVMDQILGKGAIAGNIVVIQDKHLDTKHALKTVMICDFRTEEIRAWVDLAESDRFPKLYLFHKEDNKIKMHMEIVEHAITLSDVINEKMGDMQKLHPEIVRPLSLYVFHGLLSAASEMHSKGWAHDDLHSGNVLFYPELGEVKFKVIDFGSAKKMIYEGDPGQENKQLISPYVLLQKDIGQIVRMFTALYVGNEFNDLDHLKKNWEEELKQSADEMKEADRKELLGLVEIALDVCTNRMENELIDKVEAKLEKENIQEVLQKAAAICFPRVKIISLAEERQKQDVIDGVSKERGFGICGGAASGGIVKDPKSISEKTGKFSDIFSIGPRAQKT